MESISYLNYLWFVLIACITFALTVITNGWQFLGNNTWGFRLGSVLAVTLAIVALRLSFNQMHGVSILQLITRILAILLIAVVAFWNYLAWIGV